VHDRAHKLLCPFIGELVTWTLLLVGAGLGLAMTVVRGLMLEPRAIMVGRSVELTARPRSLVVLMMAIFVPPLQGMVAMTV
jgi:hypothetical protein